eukprot:TRINITY_DN51194_c0_g1_i1.p3 TRINITY_DN51194_c0_g1~~TRINITY_DN51194_c0_g1_i1.p3  ORF type:complete len:131 (+),score=23.77 TRINITY_DN51194_c0_g1_i1:1662-2054(+)
MLMKQMIIIEREDRVAIYVRDQDQGRVIEFVLLEPADEKKIGLEALHLAQRIVRGKSIVAGILQLLMMTIDYQIQRRMTSMMVLEKKQKQLQPQFYLLCVTQNALLPQRGGRGMQYSHLQEPFRQCLARL